MVERVQRWVSTGFKVAPIEKMMLPVIHALGHKDCELIQRDQMALFAVGQIEARAIQSTERHAIEFNDLLTQSYLWGNSEKDFLIWQNPSTSPARAFP